MMIKKNDIFNDDKDIIFIIANKLMMMIDDDGDDILSPMKRFHLLNKQLEFWMLQITIN